MTESLGKKRMNGKTKAIKSKKRLAVEDSQNLTKGFLLGKDGVTPVFTVEATGQRSIPRTHRVQDDEQNAWSSAAAAWAHTISGRSAPSESSAAAAAAAAIGPPDDSDDDDL